MKNVGPALIAVLLSIMITSILASVLIPILDGVLEGISPAIRGGLAIAVVLLMLGMVYGFSVLLYDLLLKRAQRLEQQKRAEEDPNFERKPVIAFVVLGLVCVGISAYQLLVSTDTNTNIPALIGEKAVYGLIIWSIFNHYFGKHLNQHTKGASFVVVLVCITTGSYLSAERRVQADAETLARIQDNVLSLLEDEDGRITPIETDPDAASGRHAILETSLNDYLNQVIANNNAYLTELDAIGYDLLLDGDRIREDADLAQSRFIVERAHAIVDKYEQLNEQAAYDYRDNFAELAVSDTDKEAFRTSFDASLESSLERAREIWILERDVLVIVDEMVSFLAMSESSWVMEGDEYIFETDKNLAIFNMMLGEIDAAVAQQDALREVSANNTRELFDGINN